MGKGRRPCCDKAGVKKGPWSQAEDFKLISFIQIHGHNNWRALPKLAGLARCGKSCRLRWVNYLRPDLKRGNFSPQEEETIIRLHQELGNKWSKIASHFPGRTDNEIKNVWNTHLKKRIKAKAGLCHSKSMESSCNTLVSTNASKKEAIDGSKTLHGHQQIPMHQANNNDTVEYSSSSSTATSYNSHPSILNGQITNDLDHNPNPNPNPVHLVDDNFKGETKSVGEDEKNNENCYYSLDELIEMPIEPNLDLWDLLHGENEVQVKDVDSTISENDKKNENLIQGGGGGDGGNWWWKNENLIQGGGGGDGGNWWWLVYLENELGLVDHQSESTLLQPTKATTSTHHDFVQDIAI